MKIYTGVGDGGKTSLFSGERLRKNSLRVEAYGTLDELSCFIGVVAMHVPESPRKQMVIENLQQIQGDLFCMGALLATLPGSANASLLRPLQKNRREWLESRIDMLQEQLPELRSFILPGGHPAAVWSQVARTVCRRAERSISALAEVEEVVCLDEILPYTNRLSDFFFVLGRYCNALTGTGENLWPGAADAS